MDAMTNVFIYSLIFRLYDCFTGKTKSSSKSSRSSQSSKISTSDIESIIERLKNGRHRMSTRKNYRNVWKNFNEFFIRLDVKPPTWEERIALFVAYLIDKKRQSATIKSYVSAIRAVLQSDGVNLNEDRVLITSLTRSCRVINDTVRTRLPIQKGMLRVILKQVKIYFKSQPYLTVLYQALFSTAYFGLLRVGEITAGSHPILAKDVHTGRNKNKILFILHSSKTHGKESKPQMVKITSTPLTNKKPKSCVGSEQVFSYCPYTLLKEYIKVRGHYTNLREPFFVFSDHSPVTPNQMRKCLKNILKMCGFNENLYDTHSFRSGRSTDLLKFGLSVESIKKIGRWRSSAVFTYLR